MEKINIGNVVDDGTGDYLRRGGEKINKNFTELYYELGDTVIPHSAGAWKNYSTRGTLTLTKFGQSLALDTSSGPIKVILPKGTPADYNKVVRLRDAFSTWGNNPVTIQTPTTADTIKGDSAPHILDRNFQDVELVYCKPGRWEYVSNKSVDKITTNDINSVASKTIIVQTDGQTDFLKVFGNNKYNPQNLQVYQRGNLLTYGDTFSDDSMYGSPGAQPGQLVELNGLDVRLKVPAKAGDAIEFVTFLDGIASYRSSYERRVLKVYDSSRYADKSEPGFVWAGELSKKTVFTVEEFGIGVRDTVNPNSTEVFLNGHMLTRSGDADMPGFRCEGYPDQDNQNDCTALGGTWIEGGYDFSFEFDQFDKVSALRLGRPLEHGDIITWKWFNNDIGTLMDWEGDDGIKEHADKVYLNSEVRLDITGRIEYTNLNEPKQANVKAAPDMLDLRIENIQMLFDIWYPIGTIYENAHNPTNPAKLMGMGTWVRYAEGQTTVGWDSAGSSIFNKNPQDLDANGAATATAGGHFGAIGVQIQANNIPSLQSDEKVLVKDPNGDITIGQCMADPDAEGPDITIYREDFATIRKGANQAELSVIQPSVTTHKWVRVA